MRSVGQCEPTIGIRHREMVRGMAAEKVSEPIVAAAMFRRGGAAAKMGISKGGLGGLVYAGVTHGVFGPGSLDRTHAGGGKDAVEIARSDRDSITLRCANDTFAAELVQAPGRERLAR